MTNRKSSFNETFTPLFTRFLRYEFPQPVYGKRKNLDLLEVAIYGEFSSFHLNGKKIYPTIDHLAKKFGVTNKTIIEKIKILEAAGLISKIHRWNKSTIYNLKITPKQFAKMCDAQGIEHDDPEPDDPAEQTQQTQQEAPNRLEEEQPYQGDFADPEPKVTPLMQRDRDKYGYARLLRNNEGRGSEMNAIYVRLRNKYKGKVVKLSTLRDEIYGDEFMTKYIIGKIPGKIWKEESYWHCTEDVFDIVNLLLKRGVKIKMDTEGDGMFCPKTQLWDNVRLATIKREDGTRIKQLEWK